MLFSVRYVTLRPDSTQTVLNAIIDIDDRITEDRLIRSNIRSEGDDEIYSIHWNTP